MAGWSTVTAGVVGVGVGGAASVALEPAFEPLRQDAWSRAPHKVLDLGQLAQLAASGLISEDAAIAEGRRNGFDSTRVQRAIQLALKAAPVSELLQLWRRGKIGVELVDHGLAKEMIEPQYWPAIKELFDSRLDPAVIAVAIIRGIMKAPFPLPVSPPSKVGTVPAFPVSPLDAELEARAAGIDLDRLFVETAIAGRPASPQEAAFAVFRGIAERVDYDRAISEGDVRNEWADLLFEVTRQILTSHDAAELELRGYLTRDQRLAYTRAHGMHDDQSDLLYDLLGRSIPAHQIVTGQARGGIYDGPIDGISEAIVSSLRRGNLRPEYYNLANANRYSYPSAFFFRILLQNGTITAAQGEQRFIELGWPPDLAKQVAESIAGGSTSAGKQETKAELADEFEGGFITEAEYRAALAQLGFAGPALDLEVHLGDARRVKRYREKAIDAIAAAYGNFKVDDTAATAELAALNVTGTPASALLNIWRLTRLDRITLLTAPQLKKVYTSGQITQAVALGELEDRGYSATDALEFLQS